MGMPDDLEIEFKTEFLQRPRTPALEPFRVEQPSPAMCTAGQKVKVVQVVVVCLPQRYAILRHSNTAYIPNFGTGLAQTPGILSQLRVAVCGLCLGLGGDGA